MDFIKEIFKFFTDRTYSSGSKLLLIFAIVLSLVIIDNILGFSFFYNNEKSIEQLKTIQQLKKEYKGNNELITSLEIKEDQILNRKNIIETFAELFSKEDLKSPETLNSRPFTDIYEYDVKDSIIDPWREGIEDSIRDDLYQSDTTALGSVDRAKGVTNYRSRIWHTISSSYILILTLIILPFIPFTKKTFDWAAFIGMLFFSGVLGLLILLNQYLYSLIPVVLNKPWINYILNATIHFTVLWFFLKYSLSPPKKESQPVEGQDS